MKPMSSLFAKIVFWLFLNLILVVTMLAVFFAFQPYVDLNSIFGRQSTDRLRTAGMLIVHDLNRMPRADWSVILARHAAGPIVVSAEKRKDVVEITVRDEGAGVPEDLIDQLFEPFFRPEPSRDRDSGGVGLGLAIVKTCIEACNGTVSAANRRPSGFQVTIILKA